MQNPGSTIMKAVAIIFVAGSIRTLPGQTTTPSNRDLPALDAAAFANVYQQGAEVNITIPERFRNNAATWAAVDEQNHTLDQGDLEDHATTLNLGKRSVGWIRVRFHDADGEELGWTSAAIIAPLQTPARLDSPVCADSATAWFARNNPEKQRRFAVLARLASINWIRDRITWQEMEPEADAPPQTENYDTSAAAQHLQGLRVLQVFHSTPKWALDSSLDAKQAWKRFPRDLRHIHEFCREMAMRYDGKVAAWEPWNEANITGFGGHTIDEMCTLQKAAYLGLKKGNPEMTACWNVFAGSPNAQQRDLIISNDAWAYFDTFNIHSYSRPLAYRDQFSVALEACSGKPLWLTECGVRLAFDTPPPWGDLTAEDQRRQAAFVPKSYAQSLFAGTDRHFFFILGNYCERDIQFGLLRHDQTPRPGYCALAAVGRLLNGAQCLGKWPASAAANAQIILFESCPDGRKATVAVAWAESDAAEDVPFPTDMPVEAVYDCLGRLVNTDRLSRLGEEPLFVVMPGNALPTTTALLPPAVKSNRSSLTPSPIVIQAQFPQETIRLDAQAHELPAGEWTTIPVDVYQFGNETISGTIQADARPRDVRVEPRKWSLSLAPGERVRRNLRVRLAEAGPHVLNGTRVTLRGTFGEAESVVAFRVIGDPLTLKPVRTDPLQSATREDAWTDNIVDDGVLTHQIEDRTMRFDMRFGNADPWSYPAVTLDEDDIPDKQVDGLAFTITVHEGAGTLRVQFAETSEALYLADMNADASQRTPQKVVVLLEHAHWGPWSKPDPDGTLDPEAIRRILIGINAKRQSSVSFSVSNLRWITLAP